MSIKFETFRIGLDPDGEDRFVPFSPETFGAAITESTIDGDFDFPIDFEYTAQGAFWPYAYIPDYMRVTSAGRVQYYFLTPLSVTAPKYDAENIALVRPLKFAAHKDVCATFHTEYLDYASGSRIYQGHYLGAYTANNDVYAPDWKETPRYMPYHYDEIKTVYRLFNDQQYTVIVYFTRKTSGIKSCFITFNPIYYLWGSNAPSVGDFIFGLKQASAFGQDIPIESIDDIKVIPYQIVENSDLFVNTPAEEMRGIVINGNDYIGIILNDNLYGALSVFAAYTAGPKITTPYQSNLAFEIGAGSSWIRIPPRVLVDTDTAPARPGISVGFQLYVGAGGAFQLIMEVYTPYSLQSVDLSQYCGITFYWLNVGDKATQTTAAALQLVAGVLGTAASVALAVPTGGVSLIGAAAGAAGTAGGIVSTIDAVEKPPQTTSGAGSFPGSFVTRSPDTLTPILGFPVVRVYTVSYSDSVNGEMRGAYAENPAGEPFYASIYGQRAQFFGEPSNPYYMYIRADAIPIRTRADETFSNNDTALMTQSDLDEFKSLLSRGLRLWWNIEKYRPGTEVPFREKITT